MKFLFCNSTTQYLKLRHPVKFWEFSVYSKALLWRFFKCLYDKSAIFVGSLLPMFDAILSKTPPQWLTQTTKYWCNFLSFTADHTIVPQKQNRRFLSCLDYRVELSLLIFEVSTKIAYTPFSSTRNNEMFELRSRQRFPVFNDLLHIQGSVV